MNQKEFEAMESEYLSHEARVLYLMCIRRYMDYRTGLTGVVRKVSYQMFQERLEVQRRRGSKRPAVLPSLKQLRGYVDELIQVGLIEKLPPRQRTDPMVFRCTLASTDALRADEDGHRTGTTQRQPDPTAATPATRARAAATACHDGQGTAPPPGHTSVTSVTSTSTPAPTPAVAADKFAMFAGWKPSSGLAARLQLAGVELDALAPTVRKRVFGEFVSYWLGQPGRRCRQSEWEHKLIQAVLKHLSRPAATTAPARSDAPTRQQTRQQVTAAVMDIADTNW